MKNQKLQSIVNEVVSNRTALGQNNNRIRTKQLIVNDILTFNADSIVVESYEKYKYLVFKSGANTLSEKHFIAVNNGIPLKQTGYNERLQEFCEMCDLGLTLKITKIDKQINRFSEGSDVFYTFEVVATNTETKKA